MTYRFIAVHLEVTMSKTLVGKNRTFVCCQVLMPGTALALSSRALSRDWGDWGQWDQLGCPEGHQAGCWRGAKAVLVN